MSVPSHPTLKTLASSSSANLTLPAIPAYSDDLEWVTAYLVQRMLSHASWAYPYLLWIIIGVVFFGYSAMRWADLRAGYYGVLWSKWALRRRTWRKKHALAMARKLGLPHTQPKSLPSNAQLLSVTVLWIAGILISFVGVDYMAPGSYFWNIQDYPALITKRGYNLNDYYFLQPKFTIAKLWYTTGDRTGLIAFALFPLTVLFALKAPPFAILAIPQFTQICFDKLAFLHRWCAFLVWFLTTLHVAFWCVQLGIDHKGGFNGFHYAWLYQKFRFAWTAYIFFTLLMLFSLPVVRRRHYETFYFAHVLLVPLTLIFSALHHPPVWWWCWIALGLWVGERTYRFVWWLNTNGYLGGTESSTSQNKLRKSTSGRTQLTPDTLPMHVLGQAQGASKLPVLPRIDPSLSAPIHQVVSMAGTAYLPPPGFMHAELLPGKTVRVRIVTPGFLSWTPGQHFLINIPAISKVTSHPFTVGSVCDSKAAGDAGRELVFFIRAKGGWTKRLWDAVTRMAAHGQKCVPGEALPAHARMPARGVLMRAFVDGPFGSAGRARWGDHSTVVLVAGGSGVAFALSVLEYMCMCMAGRDGRELGGQRGGWGRRNFKTTRVRFVWLVREFGHIHWCASFLRRCMQMVPPSEVQIDIFVTNAKPSIHAPLPIPILRTPKSGAIAEDPFSPPSPNYAQGHAHSSKSEKIHIRSPSTASSASEDDDANSEVDLSYYTSDVADETTGELGHDEHVLDLTNFEGDDDSALPGEALLNVAVKQEGKMRRSIYKRMSTALSAKHDLDRRVAGSAHDTEALRSSLYVKERPSSMAMLSLAPMAEASSSNVHLVSPLSTASPNSAAPLLGNEKFVFPPADPRRMSQASRPASVMSEWSDAHSLAALVSEAAAREQIRLELEEEEIIDISVVAEHARAGRPALNKILADEVERAKGSLIVGCCGPTSLNAVVRKNIAAQLNPTRVRQGDLRGHIRLIAEDFEY